MLGDDNSVYAGAAAVIPSGGKREELSSGREVEVRRKKYPFKNKASNRVVKTFFCTQHGKNGTHETKDCFSGKKKSAITSGNRKCYRCQLPWVPGHQCQESRPVLAVSGSAENQAQ